MAISFEQIEQQARQLKADDRARFAESMLESVQAPVEEVEAEWKKEVEARLEAYEYGKMQSVSAEDVFAEAKKLAH